MTVTNDMASNSICSKTNYTSQEVSSILNTIGVLGSMVLRCSGKDFYEFSVDSSTEYNRLSREDTKRLNYELTGGVCNDLNLLLSINKGTGALIMNSNIGISEFSEHCKENDSFPIGSIEGLEVIYHGSDEYIVLRDSIPLFTNTDSFTVSGDWVTSLKFKYKDGIPFEYISWLV